MTPNNDLLEQLDRHLASPNLAWLLGAGISVDASIPLMYPLTEQVMKLLDDSKHKTLLETLQKALPDYAHIEHLLSSIGDYTALAERSNDQSVDVGGTTFTAEALKEAHAGVVDKIAKTIRWGYEPPIDDDHPERIGSAEEPIIKIDDHRAFVSALFHTTQAGLQERRGPVRIFSTNYDTLLEDALSLEAIPYWDGFSGGAVAFRAHSFGQDEPGTGYRAHVVKLHGSIDWHLGEDGRVWRVREGDAYPERRQRGSPERTRNTKLVVNSPSLYSDRGSPSTYWQSPESTLGSRNCERFGPITTYPPTPGLTRMLVRSKYAGKLVRSG